jgi:hypothetical protein
MGAAPGRWARRGIAALVAAELTAAVVAVAVIEPLPPSAVRAWDNEVVGVVAQVNEILALDLLFALVDRDSAGAVKPGSGSQPDPPRVASACRRLGDAVSGYGRLADSAPPSRAGTAPDLEALEEVLTEFSTACVALAQTGDPAAIRDPALARRLLAAATLTEQVGRALHEQARCPDRLESTLRTCDDSRFSRSYGAG